MTAYSRISEKSTTVRKRGTTFRLRRELEAMEFVRSKTSIPIPRVLDSHLDAEDSQDSDARTSSWFDMEKIPGTQMGVAWPLMSQHARSTTLDELRFYLEQLHALQPERSCIGSCSYGPAYDHRISNIIVCGPFSSVGDFYDFLVAPVRKCPKPEVAEEYRRLYSDAHRINFAHADISWENILVDSNTGKITGILDWEMAGFWPEWWEYRKALYGSRSQLWWAQVLKEVMPTYPVETDVDMDVEMY